MLAPHFAMVLHVHLGAVYATELWVEHFDWLQRPHAGADAARAWTQPERAVQCRAWTREEVEVSTRP